ncbi:MAG: tetratricopeptide repeat protein, partial [Desulfovibrionaceae bacterium]
MTWNGQLHNSLVVTLKDYGVFPMAQENNQALWFSPTTEIFRALARLQIYARLNPIPVFCQVMPATLQVGYDLKTSMSIAADFGKQAVEPPGEFEVWAHPKLKEDIRRIAGLELRDRSPVSGISNSGWMMFVADEGLNYETTFSWYCAVRPVGRMSEKEAVMGWRAYLERIKEIFSRLGVQYLIGTRNEMALCRLRNLRELRLFCSDLLTLSQQAKEDGSGYWPSVVAAVPQKDLQFAEEVVGKFNVDWSKLSPDAPHLHFRDAFMIREWFTIHEARYGGEESLNSWCNIGLDSENDLSTKAPAEIVLPRALMIGDRDIECFYCGLHNHAPADCPTKRLDTLDPGLWKMMARLDVKELSDGLAKLDK